VTAAKSIELVIERLGARGDGIAHWQGTPVYVDGALAGETVRARLAGKRGDGRAAVVEEIVAASPERRAPPCRHGAACGGCALQHANDAAYRAWKSEILTTALARRGIEDIDIRPLAVAPRGSRRRARLGIGRRGGEVFAGFRARQSHRLVEIDDCLVLSPALMAARAGLAPLLASLDVAEIELTETATGVDVVLHGKALPALELLERITAAAHAQDLARATWRGRDGFAPLVVRRAPELAFGGVRVAMPPGAFVQPTTWGEATMAAHVADILAASRETADLFAGLGSFAFRLAPDRTVTAVEGHAAMTAAMSEAANRAGLAGRFSVQTRDLAHAPLTAEELDRFDAVVFDPPRQGAREQSLQIAASSVPLVVAVSCHPASFGRDARILIDGGYRLDTIWPIDQFLWSHHLELVAVFRRG
jgi:23S rRNA (uracil1939-C5)-methyltransferase